MFFLLVKNWAMSLQYILLFPLHLWLARVSQYNSQHWNEHHSILQEETETNLGKFVLQHPLVFDSNPDGSIWFGLVVFYPTTRFIVLLIVSLVNVWI
jgi:hypothetical protein